MSPARQPKTPAPAIDEAALKPRFAALAMLEAALDRRSGLDEAAGSAAVLSLPARDRAFARAVTMATLRHLGPIDRALQAIIDEAVAKKAPLVEIIPGKGSGQLKKHVLRFLQQKEIKAKYHRIEKDSKNFGRVFVHFRW